MNHMSTVAAALVYISPTGETMLSPVQVAARQGFTVGYLASTRCDKNHSLKFIKVGKRVFYLEADVDAYFDSRKKVAK